MKVAVVLFNLGGPDGPEAVEPFLRNLFSDPAIIALPAIVRLPLARWIAKRRAPVARAIYAHLGGGSPIVPETQAQARALETALASDGQVSEANRPAARPIENGLDAKAFIAMRCWHPFSDGAAQAIKQLAPDHIALLPLYPQYSTTTTASSFKDWDRAAKKAGLNVPTTRICCYPDEPGFVAAMAARIRGVAHDLQPGLPYRLLLSAHGLPRRVIAKGDPYQWQVERSAAAIIAALDMPQLEPVVCYQSKVGRLEWIGPATDAEIRRAGQDGKGVIVAPLAFVSEHSETLVELDIEYAHLAKDSQVKDYRRAPAVGADPAFIGGLANLVRQAIGGTGTISSAGRRICPEQFCCCAMGE
jgi:ferrochelatase